MNDSLCEDWSQWVIFICIRDTKIVGSQIWMAQEDCWVGWLKKKTSVCVRERDGERKKENVSVYTHAHSELKFPPCHHTHRKFIISQKWMYYIFSHLFPTIPHYQSPGENFCGTKKLLFLTSMHGSYTAPLHTHTRTSDTAQDVRTIKQWRNTVLLCLSATLLSQSPFFLLFPSPCPSLGMGEKTLPLVGCLRNTEVVQAHKDPIIQLSMCLNIIKGVKQWREGLGGQTKDSTAEYLWHLPKSILLTTRSSQGRLIPLSWSFFVK